MGYYRPRPDDNSNSEGSTLTEYFISDPTMDSVSKVRLSGCTGTIIKYITHRPKILEYLSTITRDNPYINLPSKNYTLNGLKIDRLLRTPKIKLQDIAAGDAVGYVANSASAETFGTEYLKIGNLYTQIKPARISPSNLVPFFLEVSAYTRL